MKASYVAASAPPAKRRWKWFASAVLALVFFSLLVPLAFLLGLHNRFPTGYLTDERSNQDADFNGYNDSPASSFQNYSKDARQNIVEEDARNYAPAVPKDTKPDAVKTKGGDVMINTHKREGEISLHPKDSHSSQKITPKTTPVSHASEGNSAENVKSVTLSKGLAAEETKKSCQLEFGSYCLWAVEHKEEMKDALVKRLKDQLFVARAYYPSIAKLPSQEKLTREMKMNIQDHEKMLSEAIVDADLPKLVLTKVEKMDETIARAKSFHVECSNVDKKLRQILDLTEDEAHFHRRQSAFLYHLGVQTMPKSQHCLSMRLTLEYFRQPSDDADILISEKVENPAFLHYVIFSTNVLASSVTINSTVMNSKESGNMVFHLLTDKQNYFAMKFWFLNNFYKEAAIHVLNIEDLEANKLSGSGSTLSLSEEFRIAVPSEDLPSKLRTEYTSVFGHSHFLLAKIFENLKKVIVLDDDVVVQQDLSHLWSLDLDNKVLGAVQFCRVRLGQLKNYLGNSSYNSESCTWMSGINVIDLEKWREHDVTYTYKKLIHEVKNRSEASWRSSALPVSLLAFHDLVHPLEDSLVASGLGKDYGVSSDVLSKSSVLHYNGNMKPWFELGVPRYKSYWRKYLTRHNRFMDECNVNP